MTRILLALTLSFIPAAFLRARRMQDEMSNGTIDLGEAGDRFRIWRARDLCARAETYLAGQERSFSATEARATNLLGWTVAGTVAIALRLASVGFQWPLAVAAGFLFVAAALACIALWPSKWYHPGWPPAQALQWPETSELEICERMADGYNRAINKNAGIQTRVAGCMRIAWLCALAAGPVALLVSFLSFPL